MAAEGAGGGVSPSFDSPTEMAAAMRKVLMRASVECARGKPLMHALAGGCMTLALEEGRRYAEFRDAKRLEMCCALVGERIGEPEPDKWTMSPVQSMLVIDKLLHATELALGNRAIADLTA